MKDILQEQYDVVAPNYRNQSLKIRLQQHFGDEISFWYPNKWRQESELVFSNEIPTGMILEAGLTATRALQDQDDDETEVEAPQGTTMEQVRSVYHTAADIRSTLHEVPALSWPPLPQDIDDANIDIPTALYNLLAWIIRGDSQLVSLDHKVTVPPDTNAKIQSIGQDILYCARNGSVRTPKHVSLAVAAHHITGSMELVTLLNHFGHCVSKSKLQEIETAVAEQHLAERGQPILPGNIIPNVPAVFGWDNIDFLEETSTGKGTTHNTNGIMVQPAVSTCEPPRIINVTKSNHRKSLKPEEDDLHEYKVSKRPEPPRYENATDMIMTFHPAVSQPAKDTDFIWFLARLNPIMISSVDEGDVAQQTIPGWVGFNTVLRKEESFPLPHRVGYCPTISAPPTQMDVIYTFLRRSVDMVDINNETEAGTGSSSVQVEVDLGIWMKAMEVTLGMKDDPRMSRIVLRQGLLHLGMAYLSKRYGSAGLRDIFIEADVIATGSVNKVFEGQHWNRGIRAHTIGAEAFSHLGWKRFLGWLTDKGKEVDLDDLIERVTRLKENISQEELQILQTSRVFVQAQSLYADYIESLTGLQRLWSDYVEIVLLLLRFIRSAREGDWQLHIECLQEMLVWFWAYDRINYQRYQPVYLLMMHRLEDDHPDAHRDLISGELFTVQRSKENPFGRIPMDQTVESTINRDTKTMGGIVGMSNNVAASFKWSLLRLWSDYVEIVLLLLRFIRSAREGDWQLHIECLQEMLIWFWAYDRINYQRYLPVYLLMMHRLEDDHPDAHRDLISGELFTVQRSKENPFGRIPMDQTVESTINRDTKTMGGIVGMSNNVAASFKWSLLRSDRDVYTKQCRLLAGQNVTHESDFVAKDAGKTRILADEKSVERVVEIVCEWRNTFEGDNVVCHLATEIAATQDVASDLLEARARGQTALEAFIHNRLESDGNDNFYKPIHKLNLKTFDAMTKRKKKASTAKETLKGSRDLFARLFLIGQVRNIDNVDLMTYPLTDTYRDVSIKTPEREARSQGQLIPHLTTISSGNQRIDRQFRCLLRSSRFKESLISFLVQEWQRDMYGCYIVRHTLYVTSGEDCYKMTATGVEVESTVVENLASHQEEADCRLMAHASDAAKSGIETIIIQSPDTDVAVIGISHCGIEAIEARILFLTGTQHRKRYADLTSISQKLGKDVSNGLIGAHAFTGCVSVSTFVGHGKATTLKF